MTWEGAEPSGPRDVRPDPLEARRTRRAARRATLDELLQANADARALIRVLRGQLARYEQLVRVDSWRDVVTVVAGADVAALAMDGADLAEQDPEAGH